MPELLLSAIVLPSIVTFVLEPAEATTNFIPQPLLPTICEFNILTLLVV
jgi:hypothetical protein